MKQVGSSYYDSVDKAAGNSSVSTLPLLVLGLSAQSVSSLDDYLAWVRGRLHARVHECKHALLACGRGRKRGGEGECEGEEREREQGILGEQALGSIK